MIYSNGPAAQLEFPDAGNLAARLKDTRPLIRPVTDVAAGVRAYSLGEWNSPAADTLIVTEAGHWFRFNDGVHATWTCRGCGTVVIGSFIDLVDGACPKPPSHQDVANALLGRQAVAA